MEQDQETNAYKGLVRKGGEKNVLRFQSAAIVER